MKTAYVAFIGMMNSTTGGAGLLVWGAVRRATDPQTRTVVLGIALSLVVALAMGSSALAQDQQNPVKIGVLAKRGTEKCLEKWGPTAEYLTSRIPGHSFTIVPLGFEEVDPTVERGEVEFILANSSLYVGLEKLYGANRIATLKNRRLGGVTAHYMFRWVATTGEKGPWSETASVTIGA